MMVMVMAITTIKTLKMMRMMKTLALIAAAVDEGQDAAAADYGQYDNGVGGDDDVDEILMLLILAV